MYFEWHGREEKHPMLIANGVEPIIFKNRHIAGRERQPDKYAVE